MTKPPSVWWRHAARRPDRGDRLGEVHRGCGADRIAREVVARGTPGLAALADRFGSGVLTAEGDLDRAALAALAFSDDSARRDLEAITHPRIAARAAELFATARPDQVVVHDVPLLVEKGMGAAYHLVLVVDAPVEVRVARLVGRGLSEADAPGQAL